MNLLALDAGPEGAVIAGTTGPVAAPLQYARATLGVRPEHISIGGDNGVEAEVASVEYLGADSLLSCSIARQPVAVRVPGRVGLSRGDTTRLAWARGAQHFFDGASGRSIEEPVHDRATMVA
jgi:sn-glycerol 3-phosphate transport system ATP-binding protein